MTQVVTGKVRLAFSNLWTPNDKGKYSVCLLIDKDDTKTVTALNAALQEAAKEVIQSKYNGKKPTGFKARLRDGDVDRDNEDYDTFTNKWFIDVSTKFPPKVVDRNKVPLTDPLSVVAGDHVRIALHTFHYETDGNKGISFGFSQVQLVEKEPFGNGGSDADPFDDEYSEKSPFDNDESEDWMNG